MPFVHCDSYLESCLTFSKQIKTRDKIIRMIRRKKIKFDVLVGTGLSGIVPVVMVAQKLRKPFCIIRKGEKTHSYLTVEGMVPNDTERYLMIDDFVEEGTTVRRVKKQMKKVTKAEFVGAVLYDSNRFIKARNL